MMLSTLSRNQNLRSQTHRLITRLCTTNTTIGQKPSTDTHTTHESTTSTPPKDELKTLYDAVLSQISTHGWTDRSIEQAVTDLGWSVASKQMIRRGIVEVAEHFVNENNKKLAQLLNSDDIQAMISKDDHVARSVYAIRERIKMNEPFHASWPKSLALQSLPQNSPTLIKNSAHLIDEIAHFAGYSAPDISWYTDRSVLGVTYQATELYWLTDNSPGRADSWRFLERRLRESHALRTRLSSGFEGLLNLSDVASSSLSTIFKSIRTSY